MVKSVLIFGATGMVGQGVLREALLDPEIEKVTVIGRSSVAKTDAKLTEILHQDFFDYSAVQKSLVGVDATFFCLGTTSNGKKEDEYTRLTKDLTLAAANAVLKANANSVFVYVSGQGADSTEKGPRMWARVRGQLENALLQMPFKAVFIFRPGVIVPLHGIRSRTPLYNTIYDLTKPIWTILRSLFPNSVTTTEIVGQTMLKVARDGYAKRILTPFDFELLSFANAE